MQKQHNQLDDLDGSDERFDFRWDFSHGLKGAQQVVRVHQHVNCWVDDSNDCCSDASKIFQEHPQKRYDRDVMVHMKERDLSLFFSQDKHDSLEAFRGSEKYKPPV